MNLILYVYKKSKDGTTLAAQWLGLCASNARGAGSVPGQGTKIPHAAHRSQKKKNMSKSR